MSQFLNPLDFDPTPWDAYLAEIARRYHVPGIVAGVVKVDPATGTQHRFVSKTGVTSLRTGVPTDRNTVCQIGSITKIITATMILQLRDEGKLSLDTPVVELLPEFTLNSSHSHEITVRNLITHTSGIDGDIFFEMGRGEDAIDKFVKAMSGVKSLFPPNAGWSYCNSGFIVAGRITEVLDGRTWTDSVRARINHRLDLRSFFTLPEEALGHRYHVGHVRDVEQNVWQPVPVPDMHRGRSPAGVILSNVDDLLDIGAAFLNGGDAGNGESLLSAQTAAEMWEPAVDLIPELSAATGPQWTLGWMLDRWDDHRVLGHGGTKLGNKAWFKVLPEDGLAMVVFCNGGIVPTSGDQICSAFAEAYAGITPSKRVKPKSSMPVELDNTWLGTYSDAGTTLTISSSTAGGYEAIIDKSRIRTRQIPKKTGGAPAVPEGNPLLPTNGYLQFLTRSDTLSPFISVAFTKVDGHPCAYVGTRCLPQRSAQVE